MTPEATFTLILGVALVTTAGTLIGHRKGRTATGFFLSLILGLIGLVITACLPATFEAKVKREASRQAVTDAAARLRG